jgi:hypothetical protein
MVQNRSRRPLSASRKSRGLHGRKRWWMEWMGWMELRARQLSFDFQVPSRPVCLADVGMQPAETALGVMGNVAIEALE